MQVALRHFAKNADPLPRRFLNAAGTDSALSDVAMKTLTELGPTYYWAGNDAAKAKLRDKLETVGPWPALLVVVRSEKKTSATAATVRLGGTYLTGQMHGKALPTSTYTMSCNVAGWTIVKTLKDQDA